MSDPFDPYVSRLEEAFNRLAKRMAARHGTNPPPVSASQRIVLKALSTQGKAQVSEVAGALGVTLSAATGLVDRLVKAKLATRERDTADRRVVWVRITEDGRTVLAEAEARRRLVFREMIADLPEGDVVTLCGIFDRMGM